jgi:hypothetical protein
MSYWQLCEPELEIARAKSSLNVENLTGVIRFATIATPARLMRKFPGLLIVILFANFSTKGHRPWPRQD